jgi:hypothetical protein
MYIVACHVFHCATHFLWSCWAPARQASAWPYVRLAQSVAKAFNWAVGDAGDRHRIPPVTRRSFHRPRWTGVTRTRRPADSLRAEPRSWQRRRAIQSSSTRSAGYLRYDRAAGITRSLNGCSNAPGTANRHARWPGWPRPGPEARRPASGCHSILPGSATSQAPREAATLRHQRHGGSFG